MPPVCTFDWQRDYALYWNGPDGSFEDIVFGPSPDDVYALDGIRARHADHVSGKAKNYALFEKEMKAIAAHYPSSVSQRNAMMQNGLISSYQQSAMQQQANQYSGKMVGRGYGY